MPASWTTADRRRALLPDVLVLTAPGEHHEVKHKEPRRRSDPPTYGLEEYRLRPLIRLAAETQQPVFYTIHDWRVAGAHSSGQPMPNILQDWRAVNVVALNAYLVQHALQPEQFLTYLNGGAAWVPGYYWPTNLWAPLDSLWGLPW